MKLHIETLKRLEWLTGMALVAAIAAAIVTAGAVDLRGVALAGVVLAGAAWVAVRL